MLRFILIVVTMISVMASTPDSTSAQQSVQVPLYIALHGDLWSWSAEKGPVQVSKWGYNHEPFASADGIHIAYASDHQLAANLLKKGAMNDQTDIPINIWTLDMRDKFAKKIADQPANVSFRNGGKQNYIARSNPVWSPDGKALAWMEIPTGVGSQIVISNIDKGSLAYYKIPDQVNLPDPMMPIVWGKTGITVIDSEEDGYHILVIDGVGHLVFDTKVSSDNDVVNSPDQLIMITDGNKEYLGAVGSLEMLDLKSGAMVLLDSALEAYNPLVANSLVVSFTPGAYRDQGGLLWKVRDANGKVIYEPISGPTTILSRAFAISPDGQQIAFIDSSANYPTVMVYYKGQVTKAFDTTISPDSEVYPGIQGLAWAPLRWRVWHSAN